MSRAQAIFVINLAQDVNIVRPLVFLAALETEARLRVLVTHKFAGRDYQGIWQAEIDDIARRTGATVEVFASPAEGFTLLQDGHGIIVAASESILSSHLQVHELFRLAPPGFVRMTLQHGLECVGFLQNREHVIAHGRSVGFGADIACAWLPLGRLTALLPSQRPKVRVTGPTSLLQRPEVGTDHPERWGGLVCENLHSVRMRASGDHGQPFMDTFQAFCRLLDSAGEKVTLRPHPGGQFVIRNRVLLPPNVAINNLPIYRVDLKAYEYGISAPSTVVLDMVMAGIPVAVWQDPSGVMDVANYDGLPIISGLEDWAGFLRDVRMRRDALLLRQREWLEGLGMPLEPAEAYRRFADLLRAGLALAPRAWPGGARPAVRRVLLLSTSDLPTLQLSFQEPLGPLVAAGRIALRVVTPVDAEGQPIRVQAEPTWFTSAVEGFDPDVVVACRYNGIHAEEITAYLARRGVPIVAHVDDDLLNVPIEIGERKWRSYQNSSKRASLTHILRNSDLVYASTPEFRRRLRRQAFRTPMVAGAIYCASDVLVEARTQPTGTIGYMGFDHAHDLQIALPALVRILTDNPSVAFELFGSIPMPEQLAAFGDRVRHIPPVRPYSAFMRTFAQLGWDIGICPLVDSPFNRVKANTKWVEYTAVGAAVVATRGMVYDHCGSDGCATLVDAHEWADAIQRLIDDPVLRHGQVARAQDRLRASFSPRRLRDQVLGVLDRAMAMRDAR